MDADRSELLRTAFKVIEGYNKWDMNAIMGYRSPDCKHRVYPARLGRPLLGNPEYREYFSSMIPFFRNFHVEALDTVEDQKNNKVMFHAVSTADTPLGAYSNEYALILQMTEDQKQVQSIKEMVDSGYSQDFFVRLEKHILDKTRNKI